MTTDLAVRSSISSIVEIQQVARLLAMSNYFDAKGNGEQAIAQLATKILAGQEMGYGPFASVQGIHVIQGKPALSANLMAAAVKASARYDYRVRQMDDSAVTLEFFERIAGKLESLGISTFTADDARKAGTQNMNKFARNMLFARAMSNGVRWYCPDVFFGNAVYTPEELGATVNGDGDVIDVTPTPATTQAPPAHATNGNGNDNPFIDAEDEAGRIVATWTQPSDAYAWAVEIGACHGIPHARNAFERVVREEFNGKFTAKNAGMVYRAFFADRVAAALAQADVNEPLDVDMEAAPEMAH